MYSLTEKDIITSKDIVLSPILPRFFVSGDSLNIGAMISNNTSQNDKFSFSLETENLSFATETFILNFSRALINSFYKVPSTGKDEIELKMTVKSLNNPEKNDGIILKRKVYPLVFKRNWARSGIITSKTKLLPIPNENFLGTISISTNITGLLMDSIKALIDFPYGCVEQTMSRFLPTIVFKRLLNISNDNREFEFSKKADQIIEKSLKRLYGFQHADGGWGWWKTDETDSFMTAYVMHGFFLAKENGYSINKDVVDNGLKALKFLLENEDDYFYYVLYVLSLYEPNVLSNKINLKRTESEYEEILYLLAKLRNSKIRVFRFRETIRLISDKFGTDKTHIEFSKVPYFMDEVQLNALLLFELFTFKNYSKDVADICERLTNYLLSKRRGDMWKNTKETAFCIMALSNLVATDEKKGSYVKITVNDEERFSGILEGNLKISLEMTKEAKIALSASNTVFWSVHGETITEFKDYTPISSKMAIEREIQKRITVRFDNKNITLFIPMKNKFALRDIKTLNDSESLKLSYILLKSDSSAFVLSDGSLIFNNEYVGLKLLEGGLVSLKENELVVKGKLYRADLQLSDMGLYELRFVSNKALKIGDVIRSEIKVFGEGDFVVLEDPLPSTAVPIKEYREEILGKFLYEPLFSLEKEIRFDKVVMFFWHTENDKIYNYYRVMLPGKFTIFPAKMWEMYDTNNFASSEFSLLEVRF